MNGHPNLVILAGGASSRMKKTAKPEAGLSNEDIKQANERSKGLISVGQEGRPMMDYVLYNAKRAGYENIYIVIGEQGNLFREYYGSKDKDNPWNGLKISFAIQFIPEGRVKPFGTADALFQAVEQFPELNSVPYSVCNSDNLYSVEALAALRTTESPNAFIGYDRDAMLFPMERISRFALAKLDGDGHLLEIVEKPSEDMVEQFRDASGKLRVSMNAFKFQGEMLYPYLKNCPVNEERNEKELPTAFLNMLKDHPLTAIGIPFSEHVPDLTAKEDIVAVKEFLKTNYQQLDWDSA
ncbi:sugar phosphate nucleotidyltransferase [Flagellimonas myxillae]|uniref:sugar phosphate nucleotidyltransferase n=1 Tax=Flagellimonas myxillae TaxID=2942214 RepID=UPI00201F21B4|nr:sugar phosphate nucleotidyltransferase [Muricauda myxillae]MCL6265453.1 sugar phosphate nucleotidyltransferase [Muricauda myxillae]